MPHSVEFDFVELLARQNLVLPCLLVEMLPELLPQLLPKRLVEQGSSVLLLHRELSDGFAYLPAALAWSVEQVKSVALVLCAVLA